MTELENRLDAIEVKVNDNVTTIVQLVKAQKAAVTVSSVEAAKDGNGYTITFSNGTTAKITNGEDAVAPVVGVKEDAGVLYWTVNGEFLINDGAKVPVTGENGKTPEFKIEDGIWKVSFDGQQWTVVPVTGEETPSITIEETESAYVFTLGEQVITILKDLVIKVESNDIEVLQNDSVRFSYTISGADETTHVVLETKNFIAELDEANKTVTVTAPANVTDGYVMIKAVRNSDSKYSAQYISIVADAYGTFGSIIITSENTYPNW